MQKFIYLLFEAILFYWYELKQLFICCYITCMTVPLRKQENVMKIIKTSEHVSSAQVDEAVSFQNF